MSPQNLDKAQRGVVDSARIWREARRRAPTAMSTLMARVAEESLLSALADLDTVEATGEFPPGKWETG